MLQGDSIPIKKYFQMHVFVHILGDMYESCMTHLWQIEYNGVMWLDFWGQVKKVMLFYLPLPSGTLRKQLSRGERTQVMWWERSSYVEKPHTGPLACLEAAANFPLDGQQQRIDKRETEPSAHSSSRPFSHPRWCWVEELIHQPPWTCMICPILSLF